MDNAAEEEEKDTPGKAEPEGEESDDGLGEEHAGWAMDGNPQQCQHAGGFDLGRSVYGQASLLAELLCSTPKDHIAAGLAHDEVEDGDEAGVVDDLDSVYPVGQFHQDMNCLIYQRHGSGLLIA